MLELFKMAIQKPLNAIVAALCLMLSIQYSELFEVKVAIAEIRVEQITDKAMNAQVLQMNELLIRVDENVGFIKNNQSMTRLYINREIASQLRGSKE